jgi:hypothetical protein
MVSRYWESISRAHRLIGVYVISANPWCQQENNLIKVKWWHATSNVKIFTFIFNQLPTPPPCTFILYTLRPAKFNSIFQPVRTSSSMAEKTIMEDIPYTISIHLVNTRTIYLRFKIKILTNNSKLSTINELILTLVHILQNK